MESELHMERNNCDFTNLPSPSSVSLQGVASSGQHSESNAVYFSWPTSSKLNDAAEDRENYFGNLQKGVLPITVGRLPSGQRANTILELMTIRAFHSKNLRQCSLGTAIGFRIRRGVVTDIPAILVFVARKIHYEWISHIQLLPTALEGPGGIWCDVDVLEFSYFGAPPSTPKEQYYNPLVDALRGSDPYIGPGSQVATQETCGTLGAIVKSRTGNGQVGFLTNRHVAVDLDYPNQKMFHPLPPNHGPSVYLGAVERATSFITDDLWYGLFAGINPETFVRADGAFIPFSEDFDMAKVTTSVRGVGEIGDVHTIDLQSPIYSLVGRKVMKVGRSSGLTKGTIMAYALEYNDEKGICFLTDFLVVGENQDSFDMGGDSGSLILLTGDPGEKPKPVGIIWGGTGNRGRLMLKVGQPVNWTSGVDLGRLLDLLELDLITTPEAFEAAALEQLKASGASSFSAIKKSSPTHLMHSILKTENLDSPLSQGGTNPSLIKLANDRAPNIERQFIPVCNETTTTRQNSQKAGPGYRDLLASRNKSDDESFVSLRLGEPQAKRRKRCESDNGADDAD
ncbi:hypothetical protein V2J09_016201 [Rumex salicifolius]